MATGRVTTLPLPDVVKLLNTTTTAVDAFGNEQPNWADATITTTRGFLQPRASREDTQGRDVQVGDHVLFLEVDARVTGRSRARVNGGLYEVVGPPRVWRGSHVEADLRRIEG